MNTSLASKLTILQDRAAMLSQVRAFFAERGLLEVDTPLLSPSAPIDTHIDVMHVAVSPSETGYLHTSPEYAMKRLLAQGIGEIYQLSHVFRAGECGRLHNPEFTLIEWYRLTLNYEELIQETVDLIRLFLGHLPIRRWTYTAACLAYAGIDPLKSSLDELRACISRSPIEVSESIDQWDRDTLLQWIFSFLVEPHFKEAELTVISGYPASQAALAKTEGEVARRFEIYANGIELANGYDELTQPHEQRRRLIEANAERVARGKSPLPIDEAFLKALEEGLPDCRGVAVGFDRLMLLRHKATHLEEVLPFSWMNLT